MVKKEQANALLEQFAIKPTPLRIEILQLLMHTHKPISAYDLLDKLQIKRPNAKPMTLYRILDLYQSSHLVHKLEKDNTFVLCCHPDTKSPCQIIYCQECHKHTELHDDRLAQSIQTVLKPLGYQPRLQEIQIHAICDQCQQKE